MILIKVYYKYTWKTYNEANYFDNDYVLIKMWHRKYKVCTHTNEKERDVLSQTIGNASPFSSKNHYKYTYICIYIISMHVYIISYIFI